MTKWVEHGNGICWEESTLLADAGLRHGVTGKSGGVSEAPFTSLNLGLHVGDQPKAVLENRRRLCALLGYPMQKLTTAQQTHEDHVVAVGPAEIGCGAGSYADALAHTDAIMTNLPGVPLMLCIADCVPVIVYDPVKRAVAVIHDGWRGTVQRLYRVYTLLGDGEIQEGQVWEAAMLASHRKLDNLVVIVDNNGLQIDGAIDEVCSPYPIDKKFEAFNFHVINVDGHDFDALDAAFKEARETKGQPTAIIAKTIKGKNVSFMENQASWHGSAPNAEQYAVAMADLEKVGEALCQM